MTTTPRSVLATVLGMVEHREAAADTASMGQSAGFAQTSWTLLWGSDAEVDADLDAVAATGAKWLRFDFDWQSAEPTRGTYRWKYIDRVVNKARARGLRILATPAYTPTWARPAGTSDKHGPTDPTAYAAFVKAAAQRYAPLGVHHWEIWNEPNISEFWQPVPNVAHYAALLRASAAAIRSVDPKAVIVSAGLAPAADTADGHFVSPRTFLSRLYQAGAGPSFDAVGMHPYAWPYGISAVGDWNQWYSLPKTYDIMVANGDGAKRIWATEYGAPTGSSTRAVSDADQARFVKEAFADWATKPWAGPIMWYSFRDTGTNPADLGENFGLVRKDFSAKPALAEFTRAMRQAPTPALASYLAGEPVSAGQVASAAPAGEFHPVPPARILDTRSGTGQPTPGPVRANQTITVDVTGPGNVPGSGGVSAVVMNVTVTEATAPSFLSVTPQGGNATSSLNFRPGRDVANLVTVPVGTDGNVRAYNAAGDAHVLFDVVGWYSAASATSPGARHTAVTPSRVLDTRTGTGQPRAGKVGADQTITLDVTGPGGVPNLGVSAVTMNVTATEATAPSFLSVTPAGGNATSSLNVGPGTDIPNLVTVPVNAADGTVRIYNAAGSTHVLADVVGWYSAPGASGSRFTPVAPARIVDTRLGPRVPVGADQTLTADVTGVGPIPAVGVSAVVMNVTVTEPTRASFLSVTPQGGNATSNLNFVAGQDVPNLVVVAVGNDGNVRAYNAAGTVHVLFDVVGWFGT